MAWLSGQPLPTYGGVFGVLIFAFVVLPAVWSRRPERRDAALRVLDRIFDIILRLFRRR